jgi:hypothetical protein
VTVGEDHQLAEQSTGLDAGQVIRWKSWHHWTALCLLAYLCRDEPDHGSWTRFLTAAGTSGKFSARPLPMLVTGGRLENG